VSVAGYHHVLAHHHDCNQQLAVIVQQLLRHICDKHATFADMLWSQGNGGGVSLGLPEITKQQHASYHCLLSRCRAQSDGGVQAACSVYL
jgi:hypothetical protein